MNRDDIRALPLAVVGGVAGAFKYGLQPELTARRGWLAIGVGVLAYELACPPGQTLSEGCDSALENHRLLTTAAIGVTCLHLLNMLPPALDPYTRTIDLLKRPRT